MAEEAIKVEGTVMELLSNGIYKVKNANIKPLYTQIQTLLPKLKSVSFTHVRREFNKRADALANEALDESNY